MANVLSNQKAMNVLLLGATGSLGSRILGALLERPFINVTAVVRSRTKLNSILSKEQQQCQDTADKPSNGERLSVIEGSATDSGLLGRIIREKGVRVLVNAAGHAPMFARDNSVSGSNAGKTAGHGNNELAHIVRASVDAVDEAGETSGTAMHQNRIRGWFVGGMLLLDLPQPTGEKENQNANANSPKGRSLDAYLPLYHQHRIVEPILRSSKHLDWTIVCPAKMNPRSQLSNPSHTAAPPSSNGSEGQLQKPPALVASVGVPPNWTPWSWLRATPWGIGPLLEIIANSPRYSVTFEDVAEFIVDNMVRDYEFEQHQQGDAYDGNDRHTQGSRTQGAVEVESRTWVNQKIGLIAVPKHP